MKALSGYAEWFYAMARNWKPVENRDWPLFRYIKPMELPQEIYLHASKTKTPRDEMEFIRGQLTPEQHLEFSQVDWESLRGKLIATIIVTGQVTSMNSPWFFGKFGFLVERGLMLPRPIPYRGQLGFFDVTL